ncbi:hypothetical protein [Clostridium baratii]|uniref:hypothetical protein n=1 Tax=Clostridium baratii TaxID=1561 RepID=UPI0030CC47EE
MKFFIKRTIGNFWNLYIYLGVILSVLLQLVDCGYISKITFSFIIIMLLLIFKNSLFTESYSKLDIAGIKIIVAAELFFTSMYLAFFYSTYDFELVGNFTIIITGIFLILDARDGIESEINDKGVLKIIYEHYRGVFIYLILMFLSLAYLIKCGVENEYKLMAVGIAVYIFAIYQLSRYEKKNKENKMSCENKKNYINDNYYNKILDGIKDLNESRNVRLERREK